MNLKAMRNVHLYLGCFFAPLLILFLVTGCWQTFDLHRSKKDGSYMAPEIIQSFSQVHLEQRWADRKLTPRPSGMFQGLVVLMALGVLTTTVLGILMAFKYTRIWIVWACLLAGTALPVFLLSLARGFK